MSTRSFIAMKVPSGYKAIYCHFDGYPDGVGRKLKEYYDTPEQVKRLIALGSIDSLHETISATLTHREHNISWEQCKPKTFSTLEKLQEAANASWAEWLYIYNPKKKAKIELPKNWQKNYWIQDELIDEGDWETIKL